MKAHPTSSKKPEIENFKQFKLLDLISSRHLNYLREKSVLNSYKKKQKIFSVQENPNDATGYFLLSGCVDIYQNQTASLRIEANSKQSYASLNEGLTEGCHAIAATDCTILEINLPLIEAYFHWSNTHEFAAIDNGIIHKALDANKQAWVTPLLSSALVKNLDHQQCQKLIEHFEIIRVRNGDTISHRGEIDTYFSVISAGSAQSTDQNDCRKTLGVGAFFGGESLIASAPSDKHIIMTSRGTLARLEKKYFDAYLTRSLIRSINSQQLKHLDAVHYCLLDVRFAAEFKAGHLAKSINHPVQSLAKHIDQLDKHITYILPSFCGARAILASYILQTHGYRSFILKSIKKGLSDRNNDLTSAPQVANHVIVNQHT